MLKALHVFTANSRALDLFRRPDTAFACKTRAFLWLLGNIVVPPRYVDGFYMRWYKVGADFIIDIDWEVRNSKRRAIRDWRSMGPVESDVIYYNPKSRNLRYKSFRIFAVPRCNSQSHLYLQIYIPQIYRYTSRLTKAWDTC